MICDDGLVSIHTQQVGDSSPSDLSAHKIRLRKPFRHGGGRSQWFMTDMRLNDV